MQIQKYNKQTANTILSYLNKTNEVKVQHEKIYDQKKETIYNIFASTFRSFRDQPHRYHYRIILE